MLRQAPGRGGAAASGKEQRDVTQTNHFQARTSREARAESGVDGRALAIAGDGHRHDSEIAQR
jgi:hypothetical protein